ncbi:hypothetical protein PQX77_022074 [Marasmius sp. AFHP31]|nr:hypothetical protein PQX77_022074 [Marasmius sp. AFHP31]
MDDGTEPSPSTTSASTDTSDGAESTFQADTSMSITTPTSPSSSHSASTATSGEGSKTTISTDPAGGTVESQPHNASQNHSSTPAPVASIVGGVIGGVLAVGLIFFVLRWRMRRRRSQAQGFLDIEPFPTHPSKPKVPTPESDNTTPQQHSATNQDDIAARHDPDAKAERQPLVHSGRYVEDVSSTTPAVQNSLDGTNVNSASLHRPGILEVFTTDELVDALNQRLREEGRWETDESLPGYPDSDQGRSC